MKKKMARDELLAARRPIPPPPGPGEWREAFVVTPRPPRYPWNKAIMASISIGLPLLVGAALGHLDWGLLVNIGGFTILYMHQEPYAQRAVKLLVVAVGIALSFGLGSLAAESVLAQALLLGVVAFAAFLINGAWRVPPPAGFMFVLACAVGTGLPYDPASVPLHIGCALLGGCFAWVIAMSGWLFRPRGPETAAVAKACQEVAAFLAAIGRPQADAAQHGATLALRAAEDAVLAARTRWFRRSANSNHADRLYRFCNRIDGVFLAGIKLAAVQLVPLVPSWSAAMRDLAAAAAEPERAADVRVPELTEETTNCARLHLQVKKAVAAAMEERPKQKTPPLVLKRRGVRSVLASAMSRESLLLPAALRISVTVTVSTLVAFLLGNTRPYWVPLTCAAVMQGTTVVATMQRTVQRALGTALGIFAGAAVLTLPFGAWERALSFMLLQLVVQLIIVRNYGVAVTFITPLALTMVEIAHPEMPIETLIGARLFDTLLGCTIGLAGSMLLWRRSSSTRLPLVLGKTIRSEGLLLREWLNEQRAVADKNMTHARQTLQTALINLRTVYDSAVSEQTHREKAIESYWPAVIAAQRLGYLSIAASEHERLVAQTREDVEKLDRLFERLANAAEHGQCPEGVQIPRLPGEPSLRAEVVALQHGLNFCEQE